MDSGPFYLIILLTLFLSDSEASLKFGLHHVVTGYIPNPSPQSKLNLAQPDIRLLKMYKDHSSYPERDLTACLSAPIISH